MTVFLTVVAFVFADPPATGPTPPPLKKEEPKKESLFKKKRSSEKKMDADDAGLTPEGPAPAKKDEKAKGKLTDADKDLVKSLGGDLAGEDDDPLKRAAQRMRAVEEQLAALKVEMETVALQDKIVLDLKEIIERAKKKQQQQQQKKSDPKDDPQQQQQAQKQKSQGQDQQPGENKGDRGARKTKEELAKMKEQRDIWGHLPELERQLLQQTFREDKLPAFKTQLEKYYSKIAEISAEKDK